MLPRYTPYESSPPRRPNIITVATPGITTSRTHISRYTGPDGVDVLKNACSWRPTETVAGNGDAAAESSSLLGDADRFVLTADEDPPLLTHATCSVSPRLLHNVIASPEMDEFVYNRCSLNPIHWVLMLKGCLVDLFFSVRPINFSYSRVGMTNLAGERDQAACLREIRRAVRIIEGHKRTVATGTNKDSFQDMDSRCYTPERPLRLHLVLFGFSRGATTTFYTAMKLPPELATYVSLVVVEAAFDTLHNVIESSCWFPSFVLWFFRTFCDYSGEDAYKYDRNQIHLRCPIAFVMSVKDTRVPNELTQRLIDNVKADCPQIPAVEVLQLKHSRHPLMAVGNREDQDAYVAFMEGLYDRYCN